MERSKLVVFVRAGKSVGDSLSDALTVAGGEITDMWHGRDYADEESGWHIDLVTRYVDAVEAVLAPYRTDIDYR